MGPTQHLPKWTTSCCIAWESVTSNTWIGQGMLGKNLRFCVGEVEVDEGRCVVLHKGLGEDFQSTAERTNPGKGIEESV